MNSVEYKILLEQIIAMYKKVHTSIYYPIESVERDLEVYFSRKVDKKTLRAIGEERGVGAGRIRQIEANVAHRLSFIVDNKLKLKGLY
jgi:DNA-directed RNA polymerase sigma subunit (sigma70/sigma32)